MVTFSHFPRRLGTLAALCARDPRALALDLPRVLLNRLRGRGALKDALPWMPFPAIAWLEATIRPEMRVFEYGSGGSTLFWARRGATVVSVEHDEAWLARLRQAIPPGARERITLLARPPSPGLAGEFASASPGCAGLCFRDYVLAIEEFPAASFDLVVVDGRARSACLNHAASRVRPGGWLLLDNSERPGYREAVERLSRQWPRQDFEGLNPYQIDPGRTSVWTLQREPRFR